MPCNNKYMYTKENWNPNVYNLDIDYDNLPSNRRAFITNEMQEVSNKALPASQKSFVQFKNTNLEEKVNQLRITDETSFSTVVEDEVISFDDFTENTITVNYYDDAGDLKTLTKNAYTINLNSTNLAFILINSTSNENKYSITQNNKTKPISLVSYNLENPEHKIIENIPNTTEQEIQTIPPTTYKQTILHIIGYTGDIRLNIETPNNNQTINNITLYRFE